MNAVNPPEKHCNRTPTAPYKLAVVVLNWNGLSDTIKCIESLLNQTFQSFDIYLLDNNSIESERTSLSNKFESNPKIRLVFYKNNYGFAKAHNFIINNIIKQTNVPYVALLNNDAIADPDWLKNLYDCAIQTNADMVASKMLSMATPDLIDNTGHIMLNTGEILPENNRRPSLEVTNRKLTIGPCAGAALYSTNLIRKIGFFDPFFSTGYEDAEYGARAVILGYRCQLEPNATVLHKGSTSINKIRDIEYAIRIVVNIYYTYFKLTPLPIILINSLFIILKFISITTIPFLINRPQIAIVHYRAAKYLLTKKSFRQIRNARKYFHSTQHPNTLTTYSFQHFFLKFYLRYFTKYLINKEKTIFET